MYHRLFGTCNSRHAALKNEVAVKGFHGEVSTTEKPQQLNGIFIEKGIRGMLEYNGCKFLDMIFPFVEEYIDIFTGYQEISPLTDTCASYTSLMQYILYGHNLLGCKEPIAEISKKLHFSSHASKLLKITENLESIRLKLTYKTILLQKYLSLGV